jgi:preprotein translocase subunit SecA
VIFSQRKNAIDSQNIFDYSDEFLNEIIKDLINLKTQKLSDPKNNELNNKLRVIFGKSLSEIELNELILKKDNDLKGVILEKFNNARNERSKILGEIQSKEIEKRILLQSIDFNWKSHIQYLEQLRQVIGLRSYGQRDPLIEYKKEAFDLFSNLLNKLKLDHIKILMNLRVIENSSSNENSNQTKNNPKTIGKKLSRNEPCHCGSGKKFKKCCGAL